MSTQNRAIALTAAALGASVCVRSARRAYASATRVHGRAAHWVIRCSDLRPFLHFAEVCLGMRVIRHEENSKPCDITCNGRYNNAWSKTMVGYEDESFAYCIEVAYNYGVYDYDPGNGLVSIGVAVPSVSTSLAKARTLGFATEGSTLIGPDGYRYELSTLQPGRTDPFQFIKCKTASLAKSTAFYTSTLGMQDVSQAFSASAAGNTAAPSTPFAAVAYVCAATDPVPLVLVEDSSLPVVVSEYSGRHALSVPEAALLQMYSALGGDVEADEKTGKSQCAHVIHALRTFHEVDPVTGVGLGDLRIAIVSDPDGYELCLVSSETFDKAVANPPFTGPADIEDGAMGSWRWRRAAIDKSAAKKNKGRSS